MSDLVLWSLCVSLCSLGLGWSGSSSPCLCLPGELQGDEDRKSQAVTCGVVMGPHHPLPSFLGGAVYGYRCDGHPGGLPGVVEGSDPEFLLILLKISVCWSFPASSVGAQPFPL